MAGLRGEIFTDRAIRALYRASHGVPRLINLISDRALLGAYAEGEHQITAPHIRNAAREVNGQNLPRRAGQSRKSHALMLAAALLMAIIMTTWLFIGLPGSGGPEPDAVAENQGRSLTGAIERVELDMPVVEFVGKASRSQ